MTETKSRQYFTADEANRALPLVRVIVADIVELYATVHERRKRLSHIRQLPGSRNRDEDSLHGEELAQMDEEVKRDIHRVEEFVDELRNLGVELKDPVIGLVDFWSKMDGRDVLLCWKLGEDEIAYWHELDAGFGGRQLLMASSLAGADESADENS